MLVNYNDVLDNTMDIKPYTAAQLANTITRAIDDGQYTGEELTRFFHLSHRMYCTDDSTVTRYFYPKEVQYIKGETKLKLGYTTTRKESLTVYRGERLVSVSVGSLSHLQPKQVFRAILYGLLVKGSFTKVENGFVSKEAMVAGLEATVSLKLASGGRGYITVWLTKGQQVLLGCIGEYFTRFCPYEYKFEDYVALLLEGEIK